MTYIALIALCVVLAWSHVDGSLVRREITPQDNARAICNDGTIPVYYHSEGVQNNTKYIIYFEGGSFCNTAEECDARCNGGQYLCRTMDNPSVTKGGALSEDPAVNPLFADYYKVWFHYCSSDMYIGESDPTTDNGNWHFQGRRNVEGLIQSLQTNAGLADGDQLVVSGTSAGGRGSAFNCERIAAMIPGVDVRCIVDAAIFYPRFTEAPFDPACQPFNELISESNAFWNGTLTNFDINTWWVTMTKPLFIGEMVFDDYGFIYHCGDGDDLAHAQVWAQGMYDVVQDLLAEAPHVGLYLPGCHNHAMLESDAWFSTVPVGTVAQTYITTLTNWLNNDPNIHAWDTCTADPYNCNANCL